MYRVVLVDDEHVILNGLARAVPWESMNCRVIGTASNGEEGLRLIREQRPDILMTDIRMPNMDGLSMVAALRSEFPRLQITVLTAFRDFEYAQTALNLGVCRYLLKPSKMDELYEAIRTMTARLDALPPLPAGEEPEEEPGGKAGNFIVRQALDYMQAHCAEHLSLNDVAEHVYVSQWHLSKLLNRKTDQSFFDLLAGMRIARAKELLKDPALRIHEIAEETGFSDVAHFSRSFKKITGCTPGEYRNQQA
jgi:YesN/AraC family two-component response regulator